MSHTLRKPTPLVFALLAVAAAAGACSEVVGPASPASITAATPTSITAVAGTTVNPGPTVRVLGESRSPIEGVPVIFAVIAGDGSVANSSVTTNASGYASAGAWILGTSAGVNRVTATAPSLPPVVFTATTGPGGAGQLVALSGDQQAAQPNTTLPLPLSVRVLDGFGNPVSGASVTFTVTSGGGSIAGSPAVSSSLGVATSGLWTLGPALTDQTVRAQSGSSQVTFTAGPGEECGIVLPLTLGETFSGTLASGDCVIVGAFADFYSLTAPAAAAVQLTLVATAFDALLKVATPGGVPVATNNRGGPNTVNAVIKLIGAGSAHTITATSGPPGQTGPYTLTAASVSPSVENCQNVFIEPGVTTQQTLATTDCDLVKRRHDDQFFVYIAAGAGITITQRSTVFDTYLTLYNQANQQIAISDDAPGACTTSASCTNSQIIYVAPADGYYVIVASSFFDFTVGSYTLTVE